MVGQENHLCMFRALGFEKLKILTIKCHLLRAQKNGLHPKLHEDQWFKNCNCEASRQSESNFVVTQREHVFLHPYYPILWLKELHFGI